MVRQSLVRFGAMKVQLVEVRGCWCAAWLRGACGVGAGGESVVCWASLLRALVSACASVCG